MFLKLALTSWLVTTAANAQIPAADAEFAAGMSADEKGDAKAALQHLQQAVLLDPKMIEAHFAIGRIADDWNEVDSELRDLAIREYKKVLEVDPSRADALKNLANDLYWASERNESETYYRRGLALRENDPELICGIAAITAYRSWSDVAQTKAGVNLPRETPLIQSPSCDAARDRNLARVDEAIALLKRALQVHNGSELMSFLGMLHTVRAEIQCRDRRAYKMEKKAASTWGRMSEETWQRKADGEILPKCPPGPPPPPHRHRLFNLLPHNAAAAP